VTAEIAADNAPSRRVAEKAGLAEVAAFSEDDGVARVRYRLDFG
jgi:RimJ/RimL family protein N-acetyltransferase